MSAFVDPDAVEAWDSWFRLRRANRLEDLSIEATWLRVAEALSAAEGDARLLWRERFIQAMSSWRLLMDERVIAESCAGVCARCTAGLSAVLNVAAFVDRPGEGAADLDFGALRDVTALAVRALDNVALAQAADAHCRQRIGIIGLADALTLLGLRYDSDAGRTLARQVARSIAIGSLAGNVRLAQEKGSRLPFDGDAAARARQRGLDARWIDEASRHGLRCVVSTAIESQPRLARLANNVADAVNPLPPRATRTVGRSGFAAIVAARAAGDALAEIIAANSAARITARTQIDLRAAMQPWIDLPISYPLRDERVLSQSEVARLAEMASARGLGQLEFEGLPAGN